jgi:AraC-like DNA-binding protein
VRAACEQMREPEISIAEISVALGFADQSHFTRTFRKVAGMTPNAFRSLSQTRDRNEIDYRSRMSPTETAARNSYLPLLS